MYKATMATTLASLSTAKVTVQVIQTGEFDFNVYVDGKTVETLPSLVAALRVASSWFLEVATA